MIRQDTALAPGVHLILGGRRWRILSADPEAKAVQVAPAGGGRFPFFESSGQGRIYDRIRREMTLVWQEAVEPPFLDRTARALLAESRSTFVRLGLDESPIVSVGNGSYVFLGRGDRLTSMLGLQLAARGVETLAQGPLLIAEKHDPEALREHLQALADEGPADPVALAATLPSLRFGKFDWAVPDALLARDHSAHMFDAEGAFETLVELLRA